MAFVHHLLQIILMYVVHAVFENEVKFGLLLQSDVTLFNDYLFFV